jgi:hypothetical protein
VETARAIPVALQAHRNVARIGFGDSRHPSWSRVNQITATSPNQKRDSSRFFSNRQRVNRLVPTPMKALTLLQE